MSATFEHGTTPNRTDLLPWWIRYCNWLFILGIITVPIAFIQSFAGYDTMQLSLYGLSTRDAFSAAGLILAGVMLFNAFTAYALLTENDWAIDIAIADALIGIVLCAFSMYVQPDVYRYELVLLVLFLVKLMGIRSAWENTPA